MSDGNPSGTRWGETASFRWLDAKHDVATARGHARIKLFFRFKFLAIQTGIPPSTPNRKELSVHHSVLEPQPF